MKFSAETGMHKAPVKERSVRWIQRAGGQTCIIDLSGLGMFLKASLDIYKKAVRPELSARFGIEGAASLIDTDINAAAVIWC